MMRILAGVGALLLFVSGAWFNREGLTLAYFAAKTEKRTLAEQKALIAPFTHVFMPATGKPPYPAVVQFHGCAGYRADFMEQWAKVATDAGYLVIAVDSNGARGIEREEALSSVCEGKVLIGQERAGDIAASLALAAERNDVDREKIIAAGWSHGAWSLMDYMALEAAGKRPPSLKDSPDAVDPAGVILFYPYCGEGSWSRLNRWSTKAPVLAFIAGNDTIVDGPQCRAQLEKMKREGTPVDLVYYENADHVFDDAALADGEFKAYYSPADAADAAARYARLLDQVRNRP